MWCRLRLSMASVHSASDLGRSQTVSELPPQLTQTRAASPPPPNNRVAIDAGANELRRAAGDSRLGTGGTLPREGELANAGMRVAKTGNAVSELPASARGLPRFLGCRNRTGRSPQLPRKRWRQTSRASIALKAGGFCPRKTQVPKVGAGKARMAFGGSRDPSPMSAKRLGTVRRVPKPNPPIRSGVRLASTGAACCYFKVRNRHVGLGTTQAAIRCSRGAASVRSASSEPELCDHLSEWAPTLRDVVPKQDQWPRRKTISPRNAGAFETRRTGLEPATTGSTEAPYPSSKLVNHVTRRGYKLQAMHQ